jgi:two-component system cell cycle sensor histidine kinase/response regulator CckA
VAIAVVIYTAAYAIWTAAAASPTGDPTWFGEFADYPVLIAAIVAMARAGQAVRSSRVRRGWRLLALGAGSWLVANLSYDYLSLVAHTTAFPSIGDLFFALCFPIALVGLLHFPERLGSRAERVTFALDATTLMVGGGAAIFQLVILPVAVGRSTLEVSLLSLYPLGDMVLAVAVVAVLFRELPPHTRGPLHLLIVGFGALFIADLAYAHDLLSGRYAGTRITDSFWAVGYAVMAVAGYEQRRRAIAGDAPREVVPRVRLSSWLPHAALVTTFAVLLVSMRHADTAAQELVVGATALLVALVVARQIVAARENTRIEAENATRAREARFRALIQQSTDVISIVDRDGRVTWVSPSVARVFGGEERAAVGHALAAQVHPDDVGAVAALVARLLAEPGAPAITGWRQRHGDGRWIHVEVIGTNGLADPTVAGLVLNARDVSERIEHERERDQTRRDREASQAQMQQAQKMEAIGRLAGGVAHDLNNALAAIIGTAEFIAADADRDEQRADAEAILIAARRAADLTRNLVGFTRQGPPVQLEVLRLESVVTSVVAMLARTLPSRIKVETSFAAELGAIEGDATQLYHALLNLCLNAADAIGERGRITIALRLVTLDADHPTLAPGDYVALSVADDGPGMDAATRERVFEPFFTTKEPGHGTGLGLAMVYGTVKRHGGAIDVESAPGQGATFRILVPVSTRPTAAAPIEPPRPAAAPAGARVRVLVVDDELLLRAMTQRILEGQGYHVTVAAHGQEGLDALAAAPEGFAVVLLDMAMPVMAGPEMFRRARAAYPGLRVLMTTGFTSAEDAQALLDEGAYGLVTKPFTAARLLDAVATVARGQRVGGMGATVLAG